MEGYTHVFDSLTNEYVRRPESRTRIVSLVDADVLINVLPPQADIEKAVYTTGQGRHLYVTDGEHFALDVNEFGANR